MSAARTMAARRQLIAGIIERTAVSSQEQLRQLLDEEGFAVTQATLSRDLVDLGAVKVVASDGTQVYALSADEPRPESGTIRLGRVASDTLVGADHSANIVVLRTLPGSAQYLASAVDRAGLAEVIGTVAGDDTVIVVTRDPEGGAAAAAMFLSMTS